MTTDLYTTQKQKSGWESLADVAFFTWLVTAFFSERSSIGRLSLLFFMGSVALFIFFKAADIKKINNLPSAVNMYFEAYVVFYIYNFWRIHINGIIMNYILAADMLKTVGINGIFLYFVYKYCVMKNDMEKILRVYVIAQMISIAVVIIRSGGGILTGRLGSESGVSANVIALVSINCIVIILHRMSKKSSMMNVFLILFYMAVILLTGSRKGLIGMAMGFFLYFSMDKGYKKIRNILFAIIIVVISYLLIMNVDFLYDIAGHRVEALFSYFKGESFNEASLSSRDDYTQLGWKYVGKRLWSGYGLDCFRLLKGAYGTYSHNNYLELMFGCGLIGTVLYYVGYVYVLFGHLKLYFIHKLNDVKPYIVIMVVQMFLEYANVTYFERTSIIFVVISLGALQLLKSKINITEGKDKDAKNIKEIDEKSV